MSKALMVMCCFFNMGLVAASRLFVRWASYRVEKADKENDNVDKRVLPHRRGRGRGQHYFA